MATISQLVDYYVRRIASIYKTKPKASQTVALLSKQLLADNFASELNTAFDLNQAFGEQLDTIGKYVGVSRDVGIPDFKPFFGCVSYDFPEGDQNTNGFTSYSSIELNRSVVFLRYSSIALSVTQLTDFSYQQLLRFKILTNFSFNTLFEVLQAIALFFPNKLMVRDFQDMSMTYYYSRDFQLPYAVLLGSFPRPMGVRLNAVEFQYFDCFLDGQPIFNSDSPNTQQQINFGTVNLETSGVFTLKNVSSSNLTIQEITFYDPDGDWTMGPPSESLPVVLNQGDSISVEFSAFSYTPGTHIGIVQIVTISESHGAQFHLWPVFAQFLGPSAFSSGFSSGFVNN